MNRCLMRAALGFALVMPSMIARAQESEPESIPFQGGAFTITETPDMDKTIEFDGQLLARNYYVALDRIVELGGTKVALFSVGDGGNACGPGTLIAWKDQDGAIDSDYVGEDCGAPPAAVTSDTLYFVPYLLPGASAMLQSWSPEKHLATAGRLTYMPQPGTGWGEIEPAKLAHIIDAFENEAVYRAAMALLGRSLSEVVKGLVVGGGVEILPSGIFYSSGCVPHNCGGANAFMAVDPNGRKVYFAQQTDGPKPNAWPETKTWPKDLRATMTASLAR